ncbi:hypothetical protein KP509_38G052800 [Ceratopteris richardii]|uniref:Dynein regulatory complex subunit 3 n=1 Tax=Ceratopteris richardii TaxID=49495 RepID=A0A8T2Q4X6_CERRI|nr:hypothetical protein KP509_38G052800 [Ceratopteris richardii]
MVTAITNELLRSCIQLDVGSVERLDERKRVMPLKKVTHLVFSFKDLSFNKIEKIEGLESLKNLDDLSLYCNQIKHIEGLDTLQSLTSLSLGKNLLQNLEEVLYLRRLKNLRLLTLDGNPLCKDPDYRVYVIGHLRDLRFLDHRVVDDESLTAAREQYQDEMLEVKQKEADEEELLKASQAKEKQKELFKEANLFLIDALFDSMLAEDAEYLKMKEVPGLLEALDEYRQKNEVNNEEVIGLILEQHEKKKEEISAWRSAINKILDERDKASFTALDSFNKLMKKVFLEIEKDPLTGEEKLHKLSEENSKLKEKLLELEMLNVGEIQDLWSRFDDNYAVLVENCRQHFQNYFATMRMLENKFSESVSAQAVIVMEQFAMSDSYDDLEDEEARLLIHDKDLMNNCIQASHDAHTLKIDSSEDQTLSNEDKLYKALNESIKQEEIKRNRERVEEILFIFNTNDGKINDKLSDYTESP